MRPRLTETLALFAWALGASPSWAQAPSQRELNGFLIGQTDKAIAASFSNLLQADTTSDGWVDRVYLVDRDHHAYMAFKFPADRPHQTISVQVAGDSASPMIPFLGLRLGDHRETLLARLGKPSAITHEKDVDVDLYEYPERNYSIEVDREGRISSIQIFGTEGFPDRPGDVMPSLDSTWAFEHGAMRDLQTDSAPIPAALFCGPQSVRSVLADTSVRHHADGAIRVWDNRPAGWVWKFPPTTPIEELVFVVDAGRWRIWEVRYR
jgi:hypothetical protein